MKQPAITTFLLLANVAFAQGWEFVGVDRRVTTHEPSLRYVMSGTVLRRPDGLVQYDAKIDWNGGTNSFRPRLRVLGDCASSRRSQAISPNEPDSAALAQALEIDLLELKKACQLVGLTLEAPVASSPPPLAGSISTPTPVATPAIAAGKSESRVALVIGNAAYRFGPLRNPVNDSVDVAQALRSTGFEVIHLSNASLSQMREAARRFTKRIALSDVALVYYSGHGAEVSGKNYLIPVNADIQHEYEISEQAFDAGQLLSLMDESGNNRNQRLNIVIIDACRNNPLPKSLRSGGQGLARMEAPRGTFISFATAPGTVAYDGDGRNSPYTKHLLEAIRKPNIPIEQAFKNVRRGVLTETNGRQIPWENSSLIGDFYFSR